MSYAMFLHAASIAEEKHFIYLLLVFVLQFLLLSNKPCSKLLHLILQPLVFLLDLLTFGL